MLPHQERVVVEKKELDEKLDKLKSFLEQPLFRSLPLDEQGRLHHQCDAMEDYSEILGARIEAFN
jgi:hypothetical protein